jgi:hypothetical protein
VAVRRGDHQRRWRWSRRAPARPAQRGQDQFRTVSGFSGIGSGRLWARSPLCSGTGTTRVLRRHRARLPWPRARAGYGQGARQGGATRGATKGRDRGSSRGTAAGTAAGTFGDSLLIPRRIHRPAGPRPRRAHLVTAALAAPPASAQPDDLAQKKAAAEAAFRQGKSLIDSDVAGACAAFKQSFELDAQFGTQYNLALCYDKLGKLASAWGELTELAAKDPNPARRADAAKRAKALEPRLVRLLIVVKARVSGFKIMRDDSDVTAFMGVATPVDPGTSKLVATARLQVGASTSLPRARALLPPRSRRSRRRPSCRSCCRATIAATCSRQEPRLPPADPQDLPPHRPRLRRAGIAGLGAGATRPGVLRLDFSVDDVCDGDAGG